MFAALAMSAERDDGENEQGRRSTAEIATARSRRPKPVISMKISAEHRRILVRRHHARCDTPG